jgi:hypothetical protein
MRLDLASQDRRVVIELPSHRGKCIADGNMDVGMCGLISAACHDKVLSRDGHLDANPVVIALRMTMVWPLDRHTA